jgi:spore coat polysaccharide biosynthesis protein SpsF (cytidylyltransferase family)
LNSLIIVDGDDILCSTNALREVYSFVKSNSESYVGTIGLPLGMNITGFSKSILSKYLEKYADVNVLETGWGVAFNDEMKEKIEFPQQDVYKHIRMTLDYQLDADFFSSVIDYFGNKIIDASDIEIINVIVEKKFNEINISLNQQSKLI